MVSAVIFVATSCVSPLTGFAFWETNLAYEGESIYNYLQVKNLSDRTILSTNVLFGVQSVTMKDKGLTGMYWQVPVIVATSDRPVGGSDGQVGVRGCGVRDAW